MSSKVFVVFVVSYSWQDEHESWGSIKIFGTKEKADDFAEKWVNDPDNCLDAEYRASVTSTAVE